ncbi:hypothetical protein D3C83_195630 [compost metagenome]
MKKDRSVPGIVTNRTPMRLMSTAARKTDSRTAIAARSGCRAPRYCPTSAEHAIENPYPGM